MLHGRLYRSADFGSGGSMRPSQAYYGVHTTTTPWNWTVPYPSNGKVADDLTARKKTQEVDNSVTCEFHTYFSDIPNDPFYVVVMRQSGKFSVGSMVANTSNSLGWFQHGVKSQVQVLNRDKQPFGSAVQLLAYGPNGADAPFHVSMDLKVDNQGGGRSVQLYEIIRNLSRQWSDWQVKDGSKPSQGVPGWHFHQQDCWDPTKNGPGAFADWKSSVLAEGQVSRMTAAARGGFNYEAYAAWKFPGSLFGADRSLPISVRADWTHEVAFIHNSAGCAGAHSGVAQDHLKVASASKDATFSFDLGALTANLT